MLFLVLGVIVNVAVAWGIAYQNPYQIADGPGFAQVNHVLRGWTMGISDRTGRTYLTALAMYDVPQQKMSSLYKPPYWSRTLVAAPPHDHTFLDEVAYGYPFRSLSFVHLYTGDGRDDMIGIPLVNGDTTRYLPAHVIWTGTALNTAVYGASFFALIMVRLTMYRVIRHLRGRCRSCGYDLRGADHEACPECGKEIRKANPA